MEQRVSLITMGVADLERAAAFYDRINWQRVQSPDGVVAFDLIGQVLGLYPREKLAEDVGADPTSLHPSAALTLGYNCREKAEVDTVLARAEAAGAKILKPAQDVFWGGYHGYFADPDGFVWEVAYNPFSPLGPNGEFQWNGAD
jgi:catechol 2,3-dioxygenase-like lactoylglutathione lyase family enzyme